MPKTFSIEDPTGLVPVAVCQRAVAAALAVLEERSVTLEQCMAAGTEPAKQHQPDHVANFFEGRRDEGMALIEAQTVAREICGQDVRLRIVDKQAPLPH